MTWFHVVLEIYEPEDGWPKEGNPMEWIYDHKVGFCKGHVDDLVVLTPFAKIVVWKLKYHIENLWQSLTWRFRRADFDTKDWDNLSDEALENFEKEL
jgi:hypothetical protein